MGDQIKIDKGVFADRLSHFYSSWKADKRAGDAVFNGASSVVILCGKAEESSSYMKHNALHFWLLGYEFPATLMVFSPDTLYVVTTQKKANHLEPLKGGKIPVETLVVTKDPESKTKTFEKCLDVIKSAGPKVGILAKPEPTGPFADDWRKAFGDISKDIEEVDIGSALSFGAFAIKDENELRSMRTAGRACSGLINDYWIEEMSQILDSGKTRSHSALAKKLDEKIDDGKFFTKLSKIPSDFDLQQLEWAYGPVIQSGGKFDLKLSAQPDDGNLHAGTIFAGIGLRYKTYCAAVGRTYLVDPDKTQSSNYKLLQAVHELVLKEIKDGAVIKDVYNKAVGLIRSKKPDMEKYFVKTLGAGIGIELKDSNLNLNGKNTRQLKDGMTLYITTGFTDVPNSDTKDKKSQVYTLGITDTIRVARSEAIVFTKEADSDLDNIEFFFNDQEEEEPAPKKEKKPSKAASIATSNIKSSRLRNTTKKQEDEDSENKRREHQKELARKKQAEGLARFAEATGNGDGTEKKKFKRFQSYQRDNQLPAKIKDMIVIVDPKAMTVLLPIMGRPVPFHINTIKNVSSSDEGDYTHLRFNFLSPGQGVGRKDDQPFEDPSAHFVRSLTIRSKDRNRMADVSDQINELRKQAVRREQEKKEMEDVVEQDKLIEVRNRRPLRLDDVYLRPAQDGKRMPGSVEIHQNGLRYVNPIRNDPVDVVFSNIKHLFFQPCVGELIVLIHVHLKNPIMIGKRKTRDVQFYREATEMAFDETGNRKRKHRYGDEEEFEAEQEERRRRAELDKLFKNFAEKISDAGRDEDVTVDIPFREIAFNGVPHRSNVLMAPATEALVQLTEPPFTVITLSEIEVAHLERIQFGLKNFDLVFVFKDFNRAPAHINTIPVESLDNVKDWLDGCDIPYTEGPLNLNWAMIMKTVTADPHQFFADGGWSFLAADSDSEDQSESEEESAFEVSDSELADLSEDSSEEESDFDHDASADDDDATGDEDLSEEGEDWDELDSKAKKADKARSSLDDDDGGKGKKRKR